LNVREYRQFFEGNPTYKNGPKRDGSMNPEDFPYDKSMEISQKDFELCKILAPIKTIHTLEEWKVLVNFSK